VLSCENDTSKHVFKTDFPFEYSIIAEKIPIKEILRPVGICILDNYLIIQNDKINNSDCFYVYDAETLKFLFSFGQLGGAGNEYIAPMFTLKNSKNNFSVFDQAKRILYNYHISDSTATLLSDKRIIDKDKFPIQEIYHINDSILVYLTVFNQLISYNLELNKMIDCIEFETGIKDRLNNNYNQSFDFFSFSTAGNHIVTGHNFIDKLSTGILDNNYRFNFKSLSLKKECPYIDTKLYENTMYYMFIESTDSYIFAQYVGRPFIELQPFPINKNKRDFHMLFEVYDWNMNKVALLRLSDNATRCSIDEKRKVLYTWDVLNDFDFIYKYKLDDIYKPQQIK
jgi:hypothetical protein